MNLTLFKTKKIIAIYLVVLLFLIINWVNNIKYEEFDILENYFFTYVPTFIINFVLLGQSLIYYSYNRINVKVRIKNQRKLLFTILFNEFIVFASVGLFIILIGFLLSNTSFSNKFNSANTFFMLYMLFLSIATTLKYVLYIFISNYKLCGFLISFLSLFVFILNIYLEMTFSTTVYQIYYMFYTLVLLIIILFFNIIFNEVAFE